MNKKEFKKDVFSEFKDLSNAFRITAKTLNLPLKPPPTSFFKFFKSLSDKEQESARIRLEFYNKFCNEIIERNLPRSEKRYAWYAIQSLGLRPPSDLFTMIGESDCIEIFDSNGIQVYRSFNFGNFTSYSLEEILTYPWYDLFQRNSEILEKLHGIAGNILSGQKLGPFKMDVKSHNCLETMGERVELIVKFKIASPLFSPMGSISHFLATQNISIYKA